MNNTINHHLHKLRNIAIIAHIDAGKTTLTERIIFYTHSRGKHKVGEVHTGNTTTDYLEQERKRGITIVSAAVQLEWKTNIINLIDSPGHVDFTIEVERCLSVLEGAILVIDCSAGVQPQTECVWQQSTRYKVSRIIFINKCDKEGANFNSTMESLKMRLSKTCIALQYPYYEDSKFIGIFDLIEQKLHAWQNRDHKFIIIDYENMTSTQQKTCTNARHAMLDQLSDINDQIMTQYLADGDVDNKLLYTNITQMCHKLAIYPVFCGSAFHNKGVQLLLDAVIQYLPNPIESANHEQTMTSAVNNKDVVISYRYPNPVIFCFKWARDRHIGPISYCRIYSGTIKVGDQLYNSNARLKMRIVTILRLFANQYDQVKEAKVGDIIGLVGQNIITGDVLSLDTEKLKMTKIQIPKSIVDLAIKPKTEKDQDKFGKYIHDYMKEDPTISYEHSEKRETILKGIGSLQLEILVSRMQTEKGINLEISKPQVSYRTTINNTHTQEYLHKKQTGGAGQFAKVVIKAEPCENEFEFVDEVRGGHVPEQYVPAVKESIIKYLRTGVHNCPVINVKFTLLDGDHHKVDSSDLAFSEATRICIGLLLPKCEPVLLEPYIELTVNTPTEYADKIISNVCSKGGSVLNVRHDTVKEDYRILILEMAMINAFDYIDQLRCISKGYASCMYKFSEYKQVHDENVLAQHTQNTATKT